MSVKLGVELPKQIAVFDTETTGIDVENDRVVTAFIGVMDVATGYVVERYSWLIDPEVEIPEGASNVHGITTERARAEGINAKQGIFEITQRIDIIQKRGLALVLMNAPYDLTLLDREIARHWGEMRPLEYDRVFDVMVLDRALDKYRKGGRKLVDVAAAWGVPVEINAHDAEADCRMAGRVAIKLMTHSRFADMTLEQVHAKTIPTHRNQGFDLAKYWRAGKGLPGKSFDERVAAIKDVESHAGMWPMRPRTTTEGVQS